MKKKEMEILYREELFSKLSVNVDDDFNTCDSVTKMLRVGMRSEWTVSGREAVLRARQAIEVKEVEARAAGVTAFCSKPGEFDLVLMDIQMPVMDGHEATKRIRALENPVLSSIPIIAMTANAFDEDKKAALDSGMNGFISKPIVVDEVVEALKGVILS